MSEVLYLKSVSYTNFTKNNVRNFVIISWKG